MTIICYPNASFQKNFLEVLQLQWKQMHPNQANFVMSINLILAKFSIPKINLLLQIEITIFNIYITVLKLFIKNCLLNYEIYQTNICLHGSLSIDSLLCVEINYLFNILITSSMCIAYFKMVVSQQAFLRAIKVF